jgi:hypothetical protein
MDLEEDEEQDPDPEAVALAHALASSAVGRDIDYEEFSFEIENGINDGTEIKVLVIRV